MSIKYPFNYENKAEAMEKYKKLEGGFYPLGENRFWHGGIHLKGEDQKGRLLPVTPVYEGEIVAARISEKYLNKKYAGKISEKVIEQLKGQTLIVDSSRTPLSEEKLKYIAYNKLSYAGNTVLNKGTELLNLLKKDNKLPFYEIDDSSDVDKVAQLLGLQFSNDFVLMKHNTTTPGGTPISFFSLYMHLKPHGEIFAEEEKYQLFFYNKEYKTTYTSKYQFARLYSDSGFGSSSIIPFGSNVKFEHNLIFDSPDKYSKVHYPEKSSDTPQTNSKIGVRYLNVTSSFNGKNGFIAEEFCRPLVDNLLFKTESDIEIFRLGNMEKIGELKQGATFSVLDYNQHDFYEMDKNDDEQFTFKSKGKYLHILIDCTARDSSEIIKLSGKKKGFICYKKPDDAMYRTKKNSFSGQVKLKQQLNLFDKRQDSNGNLYFVEQLDSEGKCVTLNKGDIVSAQIKVNETLFILKNGKNDETVYYEVSWEPSLDTQQIAVIKADSATISSSEIEYRLSLPGWPVSKKKVQIPEDYSKFVKFAFYDSKKNMHTVIEENGALMRYLGDSPESDDDLIKVKFLASGMTGYISKENCTIVANDNPIYTAINDIKLYTQGGYNYLGTIKKGAQFTIPKLKQIVEYGGDSSSIKSYYGIKISPLDGEEFTIKYDNSLDDDVDCYIRCKDNSKKNDYEQVVLWDDKMSCYTVLADCQLMLKEGEGFTTGRGQLEAGMKINIVSGSLIIHHGYKYMMVKPIFIQNNRPVKLLEGVIETKSYNYQAPPIDYRLNVKDAECEVNTVETAQVDNREYRGYVRYKGWGEIYNAKVVNGKNVHVGFNTLIKTMPVYSEIECKNIIDTIYPGTRIEIGGKREAKTITGIIDNTSVTTDFVMELGYYKQNKNLQMAKSDIVEVEGKGLPVRERDDKNAAVIDFIDENVEISFGDSEEQFLSRPYGFHRVKPASGSSFKEGYINVADQNQLKDGLYIARDENRPLPLALKYPLNEELKDGKTVVFKQPIKATTSTNLGYPGTYLEQQNILHLEIFTDDIGFTKPGKDEKGKEEDKPIYKIEKGAGFFYEKTDAVVGKLTDCFTVDEIGKGAVELPGYSLYEDVTGKEERDNFNNTRKVKFVAGPPEKIWMEVDEESKKCLDGDFKVISGNFSKVKFYNSCPTFSKVVDGLGEDNYEKKEVVVGDEILLGKVITSKKAYPDTSPCEYSDKWGDYRYMEIQKKDKTIVKGWIERNKTSYDIFNQDTYKIKMKAEVVFYKECPQIVEKQINAANVKNIDISKYHLPQKSIVEVIPKTGKEGCPYPSKEETSVTRNFCLLNIHRKALDFELNKGGYIDTSEDAFKIITRGENYLEIISPVRQFYAGYPEVFKVKPKPDFTLSEDILFETHNDQFRGIEGGEKGTNVKISDTKKYLQVSLKDDSVLYFLESALKDSNKVKKLNYFNWSHFGFTTLEDKNKDGLFSLGELYSDDANLSKLDTKKIGEVNKKISELKSKDADTLNRKICKHPTEWEKKEKEYFKFVGNDSQVMLEGDGNGDEKTDEIKVEMEHNKALAWWEEAKSELEKRENELKAGEADSAKKTSIKYKLPAKGKIWYFHPLEFLEHFQKLLPSRANELEVYSVAAGTVVKVKESKEPGYGNYVVIEHVDGSATLYGHLASFIVKMNEKVVGGQCIGIMGNSGTKGVHLHLSYYEPKTEKKWYGFAKYPGTTTIICKDPENFVINNHWPTNTKAHNPFGSSLCHTSLPSHEGIDFIKPESGIIENWQSGLKKGFWKFEIYDKRKK